MKLVLKRVLLGVAGLVCLAAITFAALIAYAMTPPLRSFSRMHETLPRVSVEAGDTIYCRMRYCDFRFPLPEQARIIQTDSVTGGFDAVNGAIYLVGQDGGPVPMRAYAELLQKKHFDVGVADGTGCEFSTHVPDVPFVSGAKVIHYPVLTDFTAASSKQDGGLIQVGVTNHMTQIRFSYFGDY